MLIQCPSNVHACAARVHAAVALSHATRWCTDRHFERCHDGLPARAQPHRAVRSPTLLVLVLVVLVVLVLVLLLLMVVVVAVVVSVVVVTYYTHQGFRVWWS